RVGDRDDGVVEGALDVRVPVGDVLLLLAPDLLHGPGAGLRRHAVWVLPDLGGRRPLLLAGLLLAGDCLFRGVAGARVGLGALPVHRQPAAVPDALVAADLDLAADILGDLAAEVAFDLVVGLDPVAEPRDVVIGHVADPQVRADPGLPERLDSPGATDAEDVGERDLQPLLAGEVDADDTCHGWAVLLLL